jgi:hypothetical protein
MFKKFPTNYRIRAMDKFAPPLNKQQNVKRHRHSERKFELAPRRTSSLAPSHNHLQPLAVPPPPAARHPTTSSRSCLHHLQPILPSSRSTPERSPLSRPRSPPSRRELAQQSAALQQGAFLQQIDAFLQQIDAFLQQIDAILQQGAKLQQISAKL